MFGYLRPLIPELRVSQYYRYRAYYCGLCRAMALTCGQVPRLALTYDTALMSLLLSDLAGEPERIRQRRCVVRPLRAHKVSEPGQAASYCADLGLLLAHRRAIDGWRDERDIRAGAGRLALAGYARGAARRLADVARKVDARLAELLALERDKCGQMDYPAEVFGALLEEAAVSCPGLGAAVREPLAWMARQTGRWLYMIDALDDLARDEASGSYNPLLLAPGSREDTLRLTAEACRWAAGQVAAALDLMDLRYSREIMHNVVYAGMPERLAAITKEGVPADG